MRKKAIHYVHPKQFTTGPFKRVYCGAYVEAERTVLADKEMITCKNCLRRLNANK